MLLLFLIGIATRVPFQSQFLHEFDSVNFALALEQYDLRLHQPHPPGMFVFFVLLGRLFKFFLHDANASFVWINTLVSGLSAATIFWLSSSWFDRRVGWLTALVMLTSPLVWFEGEVALTYMLEFFWVLLIVACCYALRWGNRGAFFAAPLLLGLAGGIRPNTLFFLTPLWFCAVGLGLREHKYRLRDGAIVIVLMAIGIGCWLIPLIAMTGGPREFWQVMQPWFNKHPKDGIGRGVYGIYLNIKQVGEAILYGMGFSLFPALWLARLEWQTLHRFIQNDWRAQVLIVWIVPGLFYLMVVHIQRLGHAFTIMPALIILGGVALAHIQRRWQQTRPKVANLFVGAILVANSLFFLLGPGKLDNLPTYTTIHQYDAYLAERIDAIRTWFSPSEAMVLTRGRNSGIREFYLSDYVGLSRLPSSTHLPTVLRAPVRSLVMFDDNVFPAINQTTGAKVLSLPTQGTLRYITWSSKQAAYVDNGSVRIKQNSERSDSKAP